MLHPDFLPHETADRADALRWLDEFAVATRAERFRAMEHKVSDFDLVHVFSGRDPETWFELKRNGRMVVVTPEWPGGPARYAPPPFRVKVIRAIRQRRWPPLDEEFFFRSPDRLLEFGKDFPQEAAAAASVARAIYQELVR